MLRKFEQGKRDYPRPAEPMPVQELVTGRDLWYGSVITAENAGEYSPEPFDTPEAARMWAVNKAKELLEEMRTK